MSFHQAPQNPYQIQKPALRPHQIIKSHSFFQSIPAQLSKRSRQNYRDSIGSLILERYSQTLDHEVRECKLKRSLQKKIKKQKAIYKFIEQRRSNAAILENLESLKTELKNESLEKEYQIMKKERAIKQLYYQKQGLYDINQFSCVPQILSQSKDILPTPGHPQYFISMPSHKNYQHPKKYSLRQNQSLKYERSNQEIKQKNFFCHTKSMLIQGPSNSTPETTIHMKPTKKLPKLQRSKNMKHFLRYNNHINYHHKLKGYFLAVYFIKCLEKYHAQVITEKKKNFDKFWPTQFNKFQSDFKDYLCSRFSSFFKLLHQKSYYPLEPFQQDAPELKDQKRKTVKKSIQVFFSCFKDLKNISVLGKVAWALCSNMSFADKGVLTLNEVQIVCFEPRQRYMRMDKWLQKSQIVSVIFIKSLLYQGLLHPWKKWPKYFDHKNQTLVNNIRLLGSIIYRLFITVQDEYLDSSDGEMYELGNFEQLTQIKNGVKIQCSEQLLFKTDKGDNEIIGGLFGTEELKARNITMKNMTGELKEIDETVETIHQMSRKYGKQFRMKLNLQIEPINYFY